MIYTKPGDTFTAVLEGVPTGLTGTLGVRIESANGTNQTPRTTAGIAELEAASGTYAKANLVAPAAKGTYVVLWDTGGGSPEFKAEALVVSYTAPVAASGPVTLEEFKQQINVSRDDDDELLQRMLDAAVQFARAYTGRVIGPVDDDTVTVVGTGTILTLADVRSVSEVVVDGETVDAADYRILGAPPTSLLELLNGRAVTRDSVVAVTGDFGIDPLPDDLRQAILEEASNRYYDRTTGNSDSAASEEYGGGTFSRPPGWARAVFSSYRIPSIR